MHRDLGLAVVTGIAGALFDTEDLRAAMRSFTTDGHGHAIFEGR